MQIVEKKSVFYKIVRILYPYPQTPFPRVKGCVCLVGFASLQSPWAYMPGIHAGAECGAAALTKQGRLKSAAHSRCTTQRHQRLTTRIGATPQTPFSKIYRFFDSLQPRSVARAEFFYISVLDFPDIYYRAYKNQPRLPKDKRGIFIS